MAPKGKAASSKTKSSSSNRAAQTAHRAEARKLQAKLRQAEQRGRRTTLRVPPGLEAEIAQTAQELGVSENEALVRLAQAGAVAAKRRRDVLGVVGKRRAVVSGLTGGRPPSLPSPEEMQEAILADRD